MYQKGSPISSDAFVILPIGEPLVVRTFVEVRADGKVYTATKDGPRAIGICVLPPDSADLVLIQVAGQVLGFSGLTPGQLLYQQDLGQVTSVQAPYTVGVALSDTTLLLTPGGGGGTPIPTTEINDAVTGPTSTWSSLHITNYLQTQLDEYYSKQAHPALANITEGLDAFPLWKGQPWPCSAQVTGCTVQRNTGTFSCEDPPTPVLALSIPSLIAAGMIPADFMVTVSLLVSTPNTGQIVVKNSSLGTTLDTIDVSSTAPMVLCLTEAVADIYVAGNCTVDYTVQFIYWKGGKAAVTRRTLLQEGTTGGAVLPVFDLSTWTATAIGVENYYILTTLYVENRSSGAPLHFVFTRGTLTLEAGIILPGHTELLQPGIDGWQLLLNGDYKVTTIITYFC